MRVFDSLSRLFMSGPRGSSKLLLGSGSISGESLLYAEPADSKQSYTATIWPAEAGILLHLQGTAPMKEASLLISWETLRHLRDLAPSGSPGEVSGGAALVIQSISRDQV